MKRMVKLLVLLLLSALNFNNIVKVYNLTIGGTQGLAIIISFFFKINVSIVIWIINILMFIISLLFLNKLTSASIVLSTFMYPFFISITSNCVFAINTSKFIIAVMSGLISGFTLSNILKLGYSTGGINVIVIVLKKYLSIKEYISNFIINSLIILGGLFLFGISNGLYSIMALFINSLVLKYLNKDVNHCQIDSIPLTSS